MITKRTKIIIVLGFFLAIGMYSIEGKRHEVTKLSGPTMGTTYSVVFRGAQDESDNERLKRAIEKILDDVNDQMSTYIKNSEISRFNASQSTSEMEVSADHYNVAKLSQLVFDSTSGAFDPTVGPLVDLWGFGPKARPTKVPEKKMITTLKSKLGMQRILLSEKKGKFFLKKNQPQMRLDFSAVAKGYAVDLVSGFLTKIGKKNHLVEIGGELKAQGMKFDDQPWQVGIETPENSRGNVQKKLSLNNLAIATSGSYRNYYENDGIRYSHTIDPATGYPIKHKMVSVSVLSPNCAMADALATAFMVMGPQKALEFATKKNIAMYALVNSESGLKTVMSPKFQKTF